MELNDILCLACTHLQKPDWLAVSALLVQHDIHVHDPTEFDRTDMKMKERWDPGRGTFTTLTGSAAEFNLTFLMSSIGDLDIMYWRNNEMAFLDDDILTCLSSHKTEELHEVVECYKLEFDPYFPGYVTLTTVGTLKYCFISSKYYLEKGQALYTFLRPNNNVVFASTLNQTVHGPAIRIPENLRADLRNRLLSNSEDSTFAVDWVEAIRCVSWPHQVSNFTRRERHYGWPTSETIEQCVEAGCDLVATGPPGLVNLPISHIELFYWRISFSRAEVILLRSWTPKQQIIYNMLRHYVKEEILSHREWIDADKIINSYLIKTKMLQFCENMSACWWENSDFVDICCAILRSLLEGIRGIYCENYFMENCNLLCHDVPPSTADNVKNALLILTKSNLRLWFLDRYHDYFVRNLGQDPSSSSELQLKKAILRTFRIRRMFYSGIYTIYTLVEEVQEGQIHRYENTMRELSRIDDRILDYFKAFAYLFVVKNILFKQAKRSDSLYVIDFLTAMVLANQPHIVRNHPSTFCSGTPVDRVLFVRSLQLSEYLSQMTSFPDFCLLAKLLQKTLKRLLKQYGCSRKYLIHSNSNLAALMYAIGQHEKAMKYGEDLLKAIDNTELSSTADMFCYRLLYVSEMSTAFGFYLLYSFVTLGPIEVRITVSHFVNLINILCRNPFLGGKATLHQTEPKDNLEKNFPMDICFEAVVRSSLSDQTPRKCYHYTELNNESRYIHPMNRKLFEYTKLKFALTDKLYDILVKLGTEHLTRFHMILANDLLHHRRNKIWFHYRAMHLYKEKRFRKVLTLGHLQPARENYFFDFLPTPEFQPAVSECLSLYQHNIILLDDDILQVIGLLLLYDNNHLNKLHRLNKDWISPNFLVTYLKIQCLLKLGESENKVAAAFGDIGCDAKLMHFEKVVKFFIQRKISRHTFPVPPPQSEANARNAHGYITIRFRLIPEY